MTKTLCVVAVLLAAVAASHALEAGGAVLAPSAALESFLESGAHTDAEIDAMAQAEVGALLGDDSEAEAHAELESETEVEAEAGADAEVDADAAMPRDTKAQERLEKAKARAAAKKAAEAKRANPPPRPAATGAGADPVRSALKGIGADSDMVRLVYDELQRLEGVAAAARPLPIPGSPAALAAAASSPLGISDPRIRTLESRLNEFERVRASAVTKQKDATISAITNRLADLDKTLAKLKRSSEKQQQLTDKLLAAAKRQQTKEDAGTPVDYSVGYAKATLPADFEDQVKAILKSVKREARKIYEKKCKTCKRKPKTPKTYPTEGPAPVAEPGAAKPAAAKKADGKAKDAAAGPSMDAQPPTDAAAAADKPKPKNTAVLPSGKPKKLLFSPIVTGKEPTPEGMRLSKALNDISIALPVTPAYQLSSKEKALHAVLGESAVNAKWKAPR